MALGFNYNADKANKKLQAEIRKVVDRHIKVFQFIGEQFVNDGRGSHRWISRTGNLESSIGYLITLDGTVVFNGISGSEEEGKSEAMKVAKKHLTGKGLELIGVAGMEYAVKLEALGYDVITTVGKWSAINLQDKIKKVKGLS